MNRLWAAAGLLAVLITICTLAVISTQSITNSITQDIEQIADTSLQDDKDLSLIHIFLIFIHHKITELIVVIF